MDYSSSVSLIVLFLFSINLGAVPIKENFTPVDAFSSEGLSKIPYSEHKLKQPPFINDWYYSMSSQLLATTATTDISKQEDGVAFRYEISKSNGRTVQLENINTSVSAAPIPAYVWLIGSAFLGIAGLTFRKKQ